MQLTTHFTLAEFTNSTKARELKIDNTPTPVAVANLQRLAPLLEEVRALLDANPITITSGYRCPVLNKAVRGVPNSDHLTGRAADFGCSKFGVPREVARRIAASDLPFDQLINEFDRWVHISVAADGVKPRRQVMTARKVGGRTVYTGGI